MFLISMLTVSSYLFNRMTAWQGNVKHFYLFASNLLLLFMVMLYINFNTFSNSFQFNFELFNSLNPFGLGNSDMSNGLLFGIDGLSLTFMLLTVLLMPLTLLGNWYNINFNSNLYYTLVLAIGLVMLLNFWALDYISFYILFEATLPLLFILIHMYGSSDSERASFYVLMFTTSGSLFMTLSMVVISIVLNTTNFINHNLFVLSLDLQTIIWLGLFIAIMVKTPLFPMHVWLPVVHSESPLAGSMMLAGLILKLALYAITRLLLPTLCEAQMLYTPMMYIISLLTMMLTSLATLRQIDTKVIIAYSSMSHMGIAMLGVCSNTSLGIYGSMVLGVAHGFVSPALFLIVGGMLYDRYHMRIVNYYKGLTNYMPQLATYIIMLSFANIGTPLTGNFTGEFLSLQGGFIRNPIMGGICCMSVTLAAMYQLKTTNRLTGGTSSMYMHRTNDVTMREKFIMNMLMMSTLIIGICPQIMYNLLYWTVNNYIYIM
uniref:NADH-ubiquinone oxidoreductase chain 4 n=1 Tax=Yarrowia deformans TaxID=1608523 RepID=G4U4Y7_9ASCO|nr:NADH dehydrogenase subunit 4 [Yarrowia deformans]CCC29039.1 subunit ND4 of proton translocating NADH:ubiquinone oxidoreductase [Yarrowia deformans]